MTRSDKAQLFRVLTHEARENRLCVSCGVPLKFPKYRFSKSGGYLTTGRPPVKCGSPECLRRYNAMYRTLCRPYQRVAVDRRVKLEPQDVKTIRLAPKASASTLASFFGVSEQYVKSLRSNPAVRREPDVVAK